MSHNEQMIAFWNGPAGQVWAQNADQQDQELGVLGDAVLDVLAPAPGEAVLDVGCGQGTTSRTLAALVGADGRVVGVDISAPLVALARERAAGADNVSFVEADAQTTVPPGAPFDVVFSRFGVMFFDDPEAAFANLHQATAPGGRLGFVCWQTPEANPWLLTPLMALAGVPGVEITAPDTQSPGPFAFADADRVRRILSGVGWRDVEVRDHRDELVDDLEYRVQLSMRTGPLARALAGADDAVRAIAGDRVREALVPATTDGVVRLGRAAWVVTARA